MVIAKNYYFACLFFVTLFSCGNQATDLPLIAHENSAKKSTSSGILNTSIKEAILLSLENNKAFQVERLSPPINQTYESEEKATFDPSVSAGYTSSHELKKPVGGSEVTLDSDESIVGMSNTLPTGTTIDLEISSDKADLPAYGRQNKVRAGLSITQALLNGYGLDVNLAKLRQTRLDTLSSQYELQGAAETLVAEVEKTCWDFLLAQKKIAIFNDSLKIAEDQLSETQERINVGKLAAVELYAAQAEVALRREALINARSNLALTRLQLHRLLNLSGDGSWDRQINIADPVIVPDVKLEDAASHVQVALKWRPEINQARLKIKNEDLEIVKTKNGLLPILDFFITMGKSGYAGSFGQAVNDLDGDSYDIYGGVNFQFPIKNRAARARHKRAKLQKQRAEEAFGNLAQLVEIDVRSAIIEVNRTKEQISATAATRRLQEESLAGESEKFRVGKSTALLVARTQRDLIFSQVSEVEVVVKYLKALIELYRLEGSLLERRGIILSGGKLLNFPFDNQVTE